MPKIIKNEETGVEETYYAPDEVVLKEAHEAALKEKDDHVKNKLAEFQTGKSAQELKDAEREAQIAEAKKKADEAIAMASSAEERRVGSLKNFIMDQYTGGDPELKKKLEEGWGLINKDIVTDADIQERIRLAANAVGLSAPSNPVVITPGFGGGMPPNFQKKNDGVSDDEHKAFRKATGLEE